MSIINLRKNKFKYRWNILNLMRSANFTILNNHSKYIHQNNQNSKNIIFSRTISTNDFIINKFLSNELILNEDIIQHLSNSDSHITKYWLNELVKVRRPVARDLIKLLIPHNAIGFEAKVGQLVKSGSLVEFTINQKLKYPDHVILLRQGDFYETYGVDAVMMVEYCGLNAMGGKTRAGCPLKNVQAALDGLTSNGLSVAVFEEKEIGKDLSNHRKSTLKNREFQQIVSPANSLYAYDLCLDSTQIEYRENIPSIGIMKTVSGYTMTEIYVDEKCITISERLSEEAVRVFLECSGFSNPMYLSGIDLSRDLLFLNSMLFQEARPIMLQGIANNDFPNQVLSRVGKLLEIDINQFRKISKITNNNQPRSIYTSTALQIGLLKNDNVPNLLPFLLPRKNNHLQTTIFLRKWILHPPPYELADHMQCLCTILSQMISSLPQFNPISLGKVISLLSKFECNHSLFKDIYINMKGLLSMLEAGYDQQESFRENNNMSKMQIEYASILPHIFAIVSYESGLPYNFNDMLHNCREIVNTIDDVLAYNDCHDNISFDSNGRIPNDFFLRNEDKIRNQISKNQPEIKELYEELSISAQALIDAINTDYPVGNDPTFIIFDNTLVLSKNPYVTKSNNVNIKIDEFNQIDEKKTELKFIHPLDRFGKPLLSKYTTENVENALNNYKKIAEKGPDIIRMMLKRLSCDLLKHINTITQTIHWSVILKSVYLHVISSKQKGWIIPKLVPISSTPHNNDNNLNKLELINMSPYWLNNTQAITNDIDLKGMFLLTAPNMSGKSTLMRSILVAALLANCGLYIPCSAATIPRYDMFFIRTASYDIPSESKSAFALEMDDMRIIYRDCTWKSLVMIDEIGKGTSSRDGCGIAGALLEKLDERQISGIFSTHLHELFKLSLNFKHVSYKRMGIDINNITNELKWTYLLEDGKCTNSMALSTARDYGIPNEVLQRASELIEDFDFIYNSSVNSLDFNNSNHNQIINNNNNNNNKYQLENLINFIQDISNEYKLDKYNNLNVDGVSGSNRIKLVKHGELPPPILEGNSCVYILQIIINNDKIIKIPDIFYVGETESLSQRLKEHRDYYHRLNKNYEIKCLATNVANKSFAKFMETHIIKRLKKEGFDIENSSDESHYLFGNITK